MRPILALAALTLPLAACGHGERSAVSLEVNGDIASNSATVTCKESTTGMCHVLFKTGATTQRVSVAPGKTSTVSNLPAGTSFCGGYPRPSWKAANRSCCPMATRWCGTNARSAAEARVSLSGRARIPAAATAA